MIEFDIEKDLKNYTVYIHDYTLEYTPDEAFRGWDLTSLDMVILEVDQDGGETERPEMDDEIFDIIRDTSHYFEQLLEAQEDRDGELRAGI